MIRERSLHAEPKVNAKTLRQKDRIRTILRRVRRKGAHQRGNLRKAFIKVPKGISQVMTEAQQAGGLLCVVFIIC